MCSRARQGKPGMCGSKNKKLWSSKAKLSGHHLLLEHAQALPVFELSQRVGWSQIGRVPETSNDHLDSRGEPPGWIPNTRCLVYHLKPFRFASKTEKKVSGCHFSWPRIHHEATKLFQIPLPAKRKRYKPMDFCETNSTRSMDTSK